ncbi:hypothetical protein BDV32DRAFT_142260 [Aspergillus pseudonomiae]|uniref:Uncharacterized protein n=1 Tax=Aspergillus pseudonomiae TaxID=1506151 RepID=A0A5N6HN48_9EURO|nr:uncharacterized protein BDV37DRAFT_275994 [Aspergillus pseudonomiae]KAB8255147.1 hypothetical protein BDV32DRAFT_142260 [Aspergillus pseudonomiae]KAE8398544.1 hypothetical protein BDV37DRAFT_275994 [Aspergillus pseudonomiae]
MWPRVRVIRPGTAPGKHYHGPIGGTSREGALAQLGQVVSSEKRPVNACRKELTVSKNQDSFAGSADTAANQPVANLAGILANLAEVKKSPYAILICCTALTAMIRHAPKRNKSNFCKLITFARDCQTFFNPTQSFLNSTERWLLLR